jgi:hypothetical protein
MSVASDLNAERKRILNSRGYLNYSKEKKASNPLTEIPDPM